MRHVKTIGATAITAAGLIAAPAANAQAHTVTYTLWVDSPAPNGLSVSYVAIMNRSINKVLPVAAIPICFCRPVRSQTLVRTTMDDPTSAWPHGGGLQYANANPVGIHCEIRVDGVVEATGVSVCSIRQLQAGSGPPGTM